MPICIICDSRFYAQSFSSPPESCDCGEEISMEVFRYSNLSQEDLERKRREWKGETEPEEGQAEN